MSITRQLTPIFENQLPAGKYKPGQTRAGQFGDLATSVDDCRVEPFGAYRMGITRNFHKPFHLSLSEQMYLLTGTLSFRRSTSQQVKASSQAEQSE